MKQQNLAELFPLIEEVFQRGGHFTLYPGGISMLPLIRPHRDGVVIAPVPKEVRKYDILLFQRKDGSFVLHRVVKVEKDSFTFLGDNQLYKEKGIREEQLRAKVIRIEKDGVFYPADDPRFITYAKRRVFFFPLRSFTKRAVNKLCKICRRKSR